MPDFWIDPYLRPYFVSILYWRKELNIFFFKVVQKPILSKYFLLSHRVYNSATRVIIEDSSKGRKVNKNLLKYRFVNVMRKLQLIKCSSLKNA